MVLGSPLLSMPNILCITIFNGVIIYYSNVFKFLFLVNQVLLLRKEFISFHFISVLKQLKQNQAQQPEEKKREVQLKGPIGRF